MVAAARAAVSETIIWNQMEKITFISHRQVQYYRIWLLLIMIPGAALGMIGLYRLLTQQGYFAGIYLGPIIVFQLIRVYKKIKAVEFDAEFLYVFEKGFEIVVPLENIKNVEIKSLNGIYQINLHDKIQSGTEVYFKPSLIYPLDFKKQDAKVNVLRSYIRKAKGIIKTIPKNALQS